MSGTVDLRNLIVSDHIFQSVAVSYGGGMSLKNLAREFFGEDSCPFSAEKMKRLAWSNFAQRSLDDDQIRYAAFDSQVGQRYRFYPGHSTYVVIGGSYPDAILFHSHISQEFVNTYQDCSESRVS